MNKLFSILGLSALLLVASNSLFAQNSTSEQQEINDRSYAYGAIMSKVIIDMNLSVDERNPDKFVQGIKDAFSANSDAITKAENKVLGRLTRTPAGNKKEEQEFAYLLGLNLMGSLVTELSIPASDFNLEMIKKGFTDAEFKLDLKFTNEVMESMLNTYFEAQSLDLDLDDLDLDLDDLDLDDLED